MKFKDILFEESEGPFKKTPEGKLLVGEIELLRLLVEEERMKQKENCKNRMAKRSCAGDSPV